MRLGRWMPLLTRCSTFAITAAIFLLPASWAADKYKVLHTFGSGKDGSVPFGPLTLDRKGHLYGSTAAGGGVGCDGYGCGTIFQLTRKTGGAWSEEILHRFADEGDGADPTGNLVVDTLGNLYGTLDGSGTGQAAVFGLGFVSGKWTVSLLYTQYVSRGLVLDAVGNLYGSLGPGNLGAGAVGELLPGAKGWSYKQLYSFCSPQGGCPDGDEPNEPLSWDAHGNLYGTTLYGGNGSPKCPGNLGCGVAFQMTLNSDGTWAYHVMHRFADFPSDGQYPSGLVVDGSGNAYGVTGEGGVNGQGTIFRMTPSTGGRWKQTVLFDFPNCADGCFPGRTLVFDSLGNLYGVSDGGIADCGYTCGVVFKLAPQKNGKWTYSLLHKFTGKDGAFPWGVIVDDKGNIFGTTENGGTYHSGVAFEITP
jgi:hypothetical protein